MIRRRDIHGDHFAPRREPLAKRVLSAYKRVMSGDLATAIANTLSIATAVFGIVAFVAGIFL